MAQSSKQFLYEIKLFEKYQNTTQWDSKAKEIQKQHIQYLDSLTKKGKLEIAGIIDIGLENQTGLVILTVEDYEEANDIVLNDPSIKFGMMSAKLRPITIYFRKPK